MKTKGGGRSDTGDWPRQGEYDGEGEGESLDSGRQREEVFL